MNHVSTLATVYAESGDYTNATKWARHALQNAPDGEKPELQRLAQRYESQGATARN